MNSQITFKQYRAIDLTVFSLIAAVFELISTTATAKWFPGQPMAISITLAMILIAMHRWGYLGAVVAVVGGVAFCLASSGTAEQFLVYCVGNCFSLISLIYFKLLGKERVRRGPFITVAFATTAYVSVALGRFLLSLPFGAGAGELYAFLATDILSLLFASVILLVFRGVDGLIADQRSYLLRLERERREEAGQEEE